MKKQSVQGKVIQLVAKKEFSWSRVEYAIGNELVSSLERFWWPYEIPVGTPVTVTVEIGGKNRKAK